MTLIEIRYEPEFVVRFSEGNLLELERFAPSTLFEPGGPLSKLNLGECGNAFGATLTCGDVEQLFETTNNDTETPLCRQLRELLSERGLTARPHTRHTFDRR